MSDLKRCPFCGDEVEIIATGLYHWKYAIRHKSKAECVLDADAFVLPYEKEEAVRMWNIRADHKTENSSEKPNNSTISKMEQVEPQTCSFSDCDNFKNPDYERCIECKRKQIKLKTEQMESEGE